MTGSKSTEYLACNDFDETNVEWIETGDSPYLDTIDDSNRIESDVLDALEAYLDIDLEVTGQYSKT